MKPFILCFLWCIGLNFHVFAQKTMVIDSIYGEEKIVKAQFISMNMTPLLVQLIPFNNTNPLVSGLYNVTYKAYKGDKGFIFSLGATMFGASTPQQNRFLNLRLGWEKRKVRHKNWFYTKGTSILFSSGHLNIVGNSRGTESSLGAGPHWSFGYDLNPLISIGSEMMLFIGAGDNGLSISFLPPTAINVTFNLNTK
jgi:hypothetical protein